ncbi:hypothetical protein LZ009_05015 [Ramlibacter sp. XY19]|uniref:hypothetical protein n=1 Tax=Ramlibacter paludis TaxID=2908000 RepID=UPI0023DC6EFF|nr:hypothetical protein [Ramlibacter paludis]MCG2592137.1 hypothetical protein [Ramlibacter paludis]
MVFGRNRTPHPRPPGAPRTEPGWSADDWLQPPPSPDVHEGGESLWDAFNEESRRMDLAFADTQPSAVVPLATSAPGAPAQQPHAGDRWSVDDVIAFARRHNRVSPRTMLWSALYVLLEGDHYADLRPPPTQDGWATMSNLQRRLHFREHIEWAARHGKLEAMAKYLASLAEPDWVHMGES